MADIDRLIEDARALHLSGDLVGARESFLFVLKSDKYNASALHHLGLIAFQSGQDTEAVKYLKSAAVVDPSCGDIMADMGVIHRQLGDLAKAENHLKRACFLAPESAAHLYNLGLVLGDQDKLEEAETTYREAVRLDPEHAPARNNLGNILKRLNRHADALGAYEEALAADPGYAAALKNKADVLEQSGRVEEADAAYTAALQTRPEGGILIRDALLLPVIPESRGEIDDYRARMGTKLDQLLDQDFRIDDPLQEVGATNFMLAYHGLNDRDLQIKTADLYRQVAPSLTFKAPHCDDWLAGMEGGPLRVGFVSSFFHEHTVGRLMEGLITNLSARKVEVIVYSASRTIDLLTARLEQAAAKFVTLSTRLDKARQEIAADELDVLYYSDIGMEPFTYFLSFARLAPIQCAGWGHPVTTGVSTIDHFISSRLMEPAGAADAYSEKLVQLDSIPTPIKDPSAGVSASPAGTGRILCPQSLFKFHPCFDTMIGGILSACPDAELLLLQGSRQDWVDRLEARFKNTIPDVVDRIGYMPRSGRGDFLQSLASADLILDTPHYSGGLTTQEALAVGTPVVTLAGDYLRGRVSEGFYRKMAMSECVAESPEDYIDIGTRLARDAGFGSVVREKIRETKAKIFDVNDAVCEHLKFFEKASFGKV